MPKIIRTEGGPHIDKMVPPRDVVGPQTGRDNHPTNEVGTTTVVVSHKKDVAGQTTVVVNHPTVRVDQTTVVVGIDHLIGEEVVILGLVDHRPGMSGIKTTTGKVGIPQEITRKETTILEEAPIDTKARTTEDSPPIEEDNPPKGEIPQTPVDKLEEVSTYPQLNAGTVEKRDIYIGIVHME